MNSITIIVFTLFVCATVAQDRKKYENVNIETILSNDRVITNYIKCLLDMGACTKEGRELKSKFLISQTEQTFFMQIFGRINLWIEKALTHFCRAVQVWFSRIYHFSIANLFLTSMQSL